MKKTTLFLFGSLCATIGFGQFQNGDRMLSGQIRFNNTSDKNITTNTSASGWNTGLTIAASRFKSDKLYHSIQLSYNFSGNKQDNGTNNNRITNHQFGLSFGRTILTPLASRFYLSIPFTAGFNYGTAKNKIDGALTASNNAVSAGVSANLGLLYKTSKRWVFMANIVSLGGLNYNHSRGKLYNPNSGAVISNSRLNSFNFTGGFTGTPFNNLSIGVGYLLK